jgi:hypothetical protein
MKLYGTSSITVVTESISVNSIPNAGGIFLSASSIYMKNYNNEVYDLTDTNGFMRVTTYTSSGTYNYSRPGNIAYLQIVCIGGGGGGGAGARNTVGSQRGGGGGGGGGATVQRWFTSGSLPPGIYTVTVGASGSGGITGSTAGTSAAGGNGSVGGLSSFSLGATVYLRSNGGNLGGGCTVAGGANGGAEQATVIISQSGAASTMYRLVGMNGGTGGILAQSSKTPNSGLNGNSPNMHGTNFLPIYAFAGNRFGTALPFQPGLTSLNYQGGCWSGVGGGGGGGHISSSNITVDGGIGAAAYIWNTFTLAGNSGSIGQNGGDGTNNIVDGNFLIAASSSYFPTASIGPGSPGGGGGPGDTAGTINGGKGGNAGNYGAGGGGGGGATDPAQAGNGGSGGGGCVIIFEYF